MGFKFLLLLRLLILSSSSGFGDALSSSSSVGKNVNNIRYRAGMKSDEFPISITLAKELMNPLGISAGNSFLVAIDHNTDKRVGWVQIRKLGTKQRDPNRFDSKPGSFDEELDIDDQMWDEFENDNTIVVPNGFSSLPWKKEYRAFANAATERQQRREQIQTERARAKEGSSIDIWELASVYVLPEYRRQGIGSELVQRIMKEYQSTGKLATDIYLLTLDPDFYEPLGFEIIESPTDLPKPMEFEIGVGSLIAGMMNKNLICMKGCNMPAREPSN